MKIFHLAALLIFGLAASAFSAAAQTRTVVADIAALKMTTGSDPYVTVTCYYSSSGACAGGGDFDLSGTTCTPTVATVIQQTGGSHNCYYRKNWGLNGVIDARQCGVKGDGANDDTLALNACLQLAKPASGRPPYAVVTTGGGQVVATDIILIPPGVTLSCGANAVVGQVPNNDYTVIQNAIWLKEDPLDQDQTITTDNSGINSAYAGIDGCLILRGTSATLSPFDYSPTKFVASNLHEALIEPRHFLGQAITANSDGFSVTNTSILGFAQCWKTTGAVSRLVLDQVNCDGTAGFHVDGGGGGTKFDNLNVRSFLTSNSGCAACNSYTWENPGKHLVGLFKNSIITTEYQLYLNIDNSPNAGTGYMPVVGDTIWVSNSASVAQSATGRYVISVAPNIVSPPTAPCTGSGSDTCLQINLTGSIYSDSANKRSATASWTTGTSLITGSSIDVSTLAVGMNVGGCFTAGTRISDIAPSWNMIWTDVPAPSGCNGSASAIQFWDDQQSANYVSGESASLSSVEREGDGYRITNAAGATFSNCAVSNHYVGYHVGDHANLTHFSNCTNENDGDLGDDAFTGLLCDGQHEGNDCSQTEWVNGVLGQHAAGVIVLQTDSDHGVLVSNVGLGPTPGRQRGRFAEVQGGVLALGNAETSAPGALYMSNGLTFVTLDRSALGSGYGPTSVLTPSSGTCSTAPQIKIDTVDGTGVPLTWHQSRQGVCSVWPSGSWSTTATGGGSSAHGLTDVPAKVRLAMSNISADSGVLHFQGAPAVANTRACSTVMETPTTYLCAPAAVPGGRLTLTQGQPVMTADVTGAANIYYAPYANQQVPIYNTDAAAWSFFDMGSGLSLDLTSSQAANTLHDIYAYAETDGGLLKICAGPAWSSSTAGSASRGGSQDIVQVGGLWVNSAVMTCIHTATDSHSCAVNTCTYLGTMLATASGTTVQQFGPNSATNGAANCLCLYNAYNQVEVVSQSLDSNAGYTYTGVAGWRAMDPTSKNKITVVDGLAQMAISAKLTDALLGAAKIPQIGITFNNTTGMPALIAQNASTATNSVEAVATHAPMLGLWFAQAMENATGTGASPTFGGAGLQQISVQVKD